MISLGPSIERIRALLAEDTDASATYAALEARFALERVCYDRLRQRHDYISHEQLKYLRRWQPGAVVTILMEQVDPHVADTMTFSIGKAPASSGVKPEDDEYLDLGTQLGFNAKRIAKLWQGLASLALHVRLPEHREAQIPEYGDRGDIKAKVEEVLTELDRISEGTMSFSGFGEELSVTCELCGVKNVRRAGLLREGQSVFCINPDCKASWTVDSQEGVLGFVPQAVNVSCQGCGGLERFPIRIFLDMKYDQKLTAVCVSCGHENYIVWRLSQVTPPKDKENDGAGLP